MKVILDEGVPKQLAEALRALGLNAHKFPNHLRQLTNGELIKAVEAAGFDVLLTNDKNIASQQSLRGRNVAVVALPLNKRRQLVERAADVADTVRRSRPGQHVEMRMDGTRKAKRAVSEDTVTEELPAVSPFSFR